MVNRLFMNMATFVVRPICTIWVSDVNLETITSKVRKLVRQLG